MDFFFNSSVIIVIVIHVTAMSAHFATTHHLIAAIFAHHSVMSSHGHAAIVSSTHSRMAHFHASFHVTTVAHLHSSGCKSAKQRQHRNHNHEPRNKVVEFSESFFVCFVKQVH